MADKPASERSEQPTGKTLGKARSKGQVPQSQEFLSFVSIIALVAMVAVTGSSITQWCTGQLEQGMSCDTSPFASSKAFLGFLNSKISESVVVIMPICGALCLAASNGQKEIVKTDVNSSDTSETTVELFFSSVLNMALARIFII